MDDSRLPRLSKWVVVFGLCTLATLVYTSHLYLYHLIRGERVSLQESLAESASDWYAWAVLAPFILLLASHFPFSRKRWGFPFLIHTFAAFLFSFIQVLLHGFFDQLLIHHTTSFVKISNAATSFFARTFHFGLLVYWLIVITQNLTENYKNQAIRASEIQTRLAQAQLNSLKMQLHPHFLFNTLHAITALIRDDPKTAESMVARLSELLRVSLGSGNLQEVSLRDEMKVLDLYLDIERMRFHDRLTIRTEIAPEAWKALVPNLILQPLVENSIRHGIAKHRGPGVIEISAKKISNSLLLTVLDNGKGIADKSDKLEEGVGLSNTRARLQQLYGDDYSFDFSWRQENGVRVEIQIPYREDSLS